MTESLAIKHGCRRLWAARRTAVGAGRADTVRWMAPAGLSIGPAAAVPRGRNWPSLQSDRLFYPRTAAPSIIPRARATGRSRCWASPIISVTGRSPNHPTPPLPQSPRARAPAAPQIIPRTTVPSGLPRLRGPLYSTGQRRPLQHPP